MDIPTGTKPGTCPETRTDLSKVIPKSDGDASEQGNEPTSSIKVSGAGVTKKFSDLHYTDRHTNVKFH